LLVESCPKFYHENKLYFSRLIFSLFDKLTLLSAL
jgi:hypothetical protein